MKTKNATLVMSVILLIVAIVMYWLCGFGTGLLMTLICGALIAFNVKLVDKNPRWWLIILAFIISLSLVNCSFQELKDAMCMKDADEIITEIQSEEETKTDVPNEPVEIEQPDEIENIDDVKVEDESEPEPVVVEKIVEKEVKVPVVVEKEVIKYVEVPTKETVTQPTTTPSYNNNYNSSYYGDPTNGGYGYGYSNDPTMNNNYGYGYGYTGDPTSAGYNSNYYYYSSSMKITGDTTVVAGDTETYTITGVSSISRNKFDLPDNVTIEDITGNRVELYFEEGWTGTYSIGYGSAELKIKVKSN